MYPNLLYKYRDWSNEFHKRLLISNEIYLSSPSEFNDPFDCGILEDWSRLDTEENKEKFINMYLDKFFYLIRESGHTRVEMYELMKKDLTNPIEYGKRTDSLIRSSLHYRLGVFSTCVIWSNLLIWSHYAFNHKGFCVGISTEKLINSINPGAFGYVLYNDNFPSIDPFDFDSDNGAYKSLFTKAADWKYEQEFRFAKILNHKNERTVNLHNDSIEEVILGVSISIEHKTEISKICHERGIRIFQARLRYNKFELERIGL